MTECSYWTSFTNTSVYLFSGVVVTAVRSNGLAAPQHLNTCDWVPRLTIDSTA